MTEKFGRSYRIVIDPKDGQPPIVIAMPLTVQFWIKRNQMASLNFLSVDIFNLGEELRNRIFQDRFEVRNRTITFEGGYDTLSLMFKGVIFEANSSRNGTDIITRIEARDGSFDVNTTKTFVTIDKGQTVGSVLDFLVGRFTNIEKGAIGEYSDVIERPVTLSGNNYELIKTYSDNEVFIDNNKIYILKDNEVIEGDVPVINIDTGILETPKRNDGFLSITTLFEPRIKVGQIIDLESSILEVYNGQYKVMGVMHQGIISEAVGGDCRSSFDLWVGNNNFVITAES